MTTPNFPSSPVVGQTFQWGSIVYECVEAGANPRWRSLSNADKGLRSDLAAAGSNVLVGGVQASLIASSYNRRRVDVRDFGVVFDGSDEGVKFRTALAAGVPLYFPPNKTVIVGPDPASAFNDGGNTRYTRCISIPSNADLMFGPNFTIKGVDGLQSWTRIVVAENVGNIKIHGTLKVDANIQNVGSPNNEHMHAIFLWNVKDFEADTLHGINSRGDNVFIGGTDEVTFSDNIRIRAVLGSTAGRKNLVIHMVDNLVIDYANLNNELGGAGLYGGVADDTDKHSLDVEPDAFTGSRVFRQYIGELRTRGQGNDFTAGTTPTQADRWVLTIGNLHHRNVGNSAVRTWLQYGITINVLGDLRLYDCFGVDETVLLQYAARLNVSRSIKITGSCLTASKAMIAAYASGGNTNTPSIKAQEIEIISSNGGGLFLRSCSLDVCTLNTSCPSYSFIFGDNVSTAENKAMFKVGRLVTNNTGSTYVGYIDTPVLAAPYTSIGEVFVTDTRQTKASSIFLVDVGNSINFSVRYVQETSGIPLVVWNGSDKYVKTSAYSYLCQGSPLGMISAPIGSKATRLDGGISNTLYIKESGTDSSGWRAMQ